LCPVDFSDSSAAACAAAQALARQFQANRNSPALFADDDAATECFMSDGSPASAILFFAERRAVDEIIMGAHGRDPGRPVLGSTAEKVLRKARCPVAVLRGRRAGASADAPDAMRVQRILFCADLSGAAQRSFPYAAAMAMEHNAELTLFHAVRHAADLAETEKRLALLIPPYWNGREIKTAALVGKAGDRIAEYARKIDVDVAVMTLRNRSFVNRVMFDSTIDRVIQSGWCPVLVVRPDLLENQPARAPAGDARSERKASS